MLDIGNQTINPSKANIKTKLGEELFKKFNWNPTSRKKKTRVLDKKLYLYCFLGLHASFYLTDERRRKNPLQDEDEDGNSEVFNY